MNITMRLSVVRNELQDALRQQQCILQRLSSDAQLLDLLVEREANIFGKYVLSVFCYVCNRINSIHRRIGSICMCIQAPEFYVDTLIVTMN